MYTAREDLGEGKKGVSLGAVLLVTGAVLAIVLESFVPRLLGFVIVALGTVCMIVSARLYLRYFDNRSLFRIAFGITEPRNEEERTRRGLVVRKALSRKASILHSAFAREEALLAKVSSSDSEEVQALERALEHAREIIRNEKQNFWKLAQDPAAYFGFQSIKSHKVFLPGGQYFVTLWEKDEGSATELSPSASS